MLFPLRTPKNGFLGPFTPFSRLWVGGGVGVREAMSFMPYAWWFSVRDHLLVDRE
jgi:hypothetical protein